MINRIIDLPKRESFFLFGPRQTGKSTLIETRYTESIWKVDLLLSDLFLKYSKDPSLFRKEAETKIREGIHTLFIDEIQRVPLLLNEVQALMRDPGCQFILTGSSARKLRRGGANLLGGRAVERHLFPFVYGEIEKQFDLEDALLFGTLPPVIGREQKDRIDFLTTYVHTYLREEIQAEGIVRNLGGFSRFLDIAASQFAEPVSFSSTARECQLPVRTVQSYYEILEDTLIGLQLLPWRKSLRKRLAGHPKFYFFDLGVTNAVNKRLTAPLDRITRGKLFEQLLVLEADRLIHYKRSEANLYFWRTNHGAEVDLLIEKHGEILAAFEFKSIAYIGGADLSGIRAFKEEHSRIPCFLVCTASHPYDIGDVRILPWQTYLRRLPSLI
ncbi:MAG: ATP-binding protein [Candidatus Omnitrophica bacterium]|nr:ATP-binding protein [Candidatus Omnitrophota bacterium]